MAILPPKTLFTPLHVDLGVVGFWEDRSSSDTSIAGPYLMDPLEYWLRFGRTFGHQHFDLVQYAGLGTPLLNEIGGHISHRPIVPDGDACHDACHQVPMGD